MSMFAIKFILSFSLSFLILSIPVDKKPLFDHIHRVVSPMTTAFLNTLKEKIQSGFEASKRMGRKSFANTKPQRDQVHKRPAATLREHPEDGPYTDEERELLRRIMQQPEH